MECCYIWFVISINNTVFYVKIKYRYKLKFNNIKTMNKNHQTPFKACGPSIKLINQLKNLITGYGDGLGKFILNLIFF